MRVGIIGAGQLGQMLGFAARKLDVECEYIDPADDPPAAACGLVHQCAFDDAAALESLAANCDVVTYEFENVPVDALLHITDRVPVYPPPEALRQSQDRLDEKRLFGELGIPLPKYHAVDSREDLDQAANILGLPMVVKTRRFGYDGKGQAVVGDTAALDAAWSKLGQQPLIAEEWIPFDREVSCIGARNVAGDIEIYPLAENVHKDGILHTSRSPYENEAIAPAANAYVKSLLEHLDYVGVIALELFVVGERLLANEFAPRVHNSGHWSIEGSTTSQFENHIRAVLGMPLGSTRSLGYAGMYNLIGWISPATRALGVGTLHDYGKAARPARKLGHVTTVSASPGQRDDDLARLERTVTQSTSQSETGA